MKKYKKIANWILSQVDSSTGDVITHLKLQKIIYYCQSRNLVLNGEALFEEDFQAWTHGPVLPQLYEEYQKWGRNPITEVKSYGKIEETERDVLNEVRNLYGGFSARKLEEITHSEEPRIQARGGIPLDERCENIIDKTVMKEYYSHLYTTHGKAT